VTDIARSSFKQFASRAGQATQAPLVSLGCVLADEPLPLVVSPRDDDVDLAGWASVHRDWVGERLVEHGGVLFRGFAIGGRAGFAVAVRSLTDEIAAYIDQHTPREAVGEGLYTSTRYPADQMIELHSEMSYSSSWPRAVWFYCQVPAVTGGETPIADNRRVYALLPRPLRERFEELGVRYVRNFGQGVGLSWQQAFQTEDRAQVERFCRTEGIEFEWKPGGGLRTARVGPAVVVHPQTGERLWFNQAHAFHPSGLPAPVREALARTLAERDYPSNASYGDGTPIADADLAEIRLTHARVAVTFPWRQHDVLMLDNMLICHGRRPFTGDRQMFVAMAGRQQERS
jgi:alpha-ketoglutarate-dependent taurine dioxygenase